MTAAGVNCLVICGPTASGKTRLGVGLALRFGGEVLSADSRQVYRGMDIGTGKDLDEYEVDGRRVPCHLVDIADPAEVYSLWKYQRDFYKAFRKVRGSGRLPVVVGGTGLYIEAVLKNYAIPNVPEDPGLRERLMRKTLEELLGRLEELDPAILEKTDRSSKKRVARSLEVALHARDHEVEWGVPDAPEILPLILVVEVPRPELHERIRGRLESRFEDGMIDEVKRLVAGGLSRERLNMFGMEYGHIARYLAGEVSREEMFEELFVAIRQLAKRQETWFRGMERRGFEVHRIQGADTDRAGRIVEERPHG